MRSDVAFVCDDFHVRGEALKHLALAERLVEPKVHGDAVTLGIEEPLDLLNIVVRPWRATGRTDLALVIRGEARHEVPRQYLDCSEAREWLAEAVAR